MTMETFGNKVFMTDPQLARRQRLSVVKWTFYKSTQKFSPVFKETYLKWLFFFCLAESMKTSLISPSLPSNYQYDQSWDWSIKLITMNLYLHASSDSFHHVWFLHVIIQLSAPSHWVQIWLSKLHYKYKWLFLNRTARLWQPWLKSVNDTTRQCHSTLF